MLPGQVVISLINCGRSVSRVGFAGEDDLHGRHSSWKSFQALDVAEISKARL